MRIYSQMLCEIMIMFSLHVTVRWWQQLYFLAQTRWLLKRVDHEWPRGGDCLETTYCGSRICIATANVLNRSNWKCCNKLLQLQRTLVSSETIVFSYKSDLHSQFWTQIDSNKFTVGNTIEWGGGCYIARQRKKSNSPMFCGSVL